MLEIVVDILLITMAAYGTLGLLFAIYFVAKGAVQLDEDVKSSPWHFKLIIIPGAIMLWVVLLLKLLRK